MSSSRISPVSFLKLSADVASFYGFQPIRDIEKSVLRNTKYKEADTSPRPRPATSFTFVSAAAICATHATQRPQEPALGFFASPIPSHLPYGASPKEIAEFGLHVVGTTESVGEIILIKTITTILEEWQSPLARVRVNAQGDKDSQQRFLRELGLFVRKHQGDFGAHQEALLAQPLLLYHMDAPEVVALRSEAPRPINFLSERSRTHFRGVLEHLEHLGIPYALDDALVGDDRSQHITFAFDINGGDATILSASGGRFDDFVRQWGRRQGGAVSASIFFRKKGATSGTFSVKTSAPKPKVYFAQLGLRAKLQGLTVVDMLRAARIPVEQSFDATRLSSQLADAAAQGVSHLLIMGQREALDGTIIVRSMQNSAQSILHVTDIPRFLKSLR